MQIDKNKQWYILAFFVFVSLAIYYLSPMLAPFVFGALVAYLGDPFVDRLEKLKVPRGLAVVLVFLAIILVVSLLVLLFVPLLQNQFDGLIQRAPEYGQWLDEAITKLATYFGLSGGSLNLQELAKEALPQAGGAGKSILNAIFQSGSAVMGVIVFVTLTPIIAFYLMRDWDIMIVRIRDLIPNSVLGTVSQLAKESDSMVSAFLRGQLLVMTGLGMIYAAGLSLIGLQSALLIGFIAGLLSFIPYLGTAVGIVLAAILFLVEYQDWFGLWQVALVFFIGQAIEGYVLTPWLVGDRIGLHPLAVIFAVLAGGELFGFTGVLLALPISAVLAVIIRHALKRYKQSELYKKEPPDMGNDEEGSETIITP